MHGQPSMIMEERRGGLEFARAATIGDDARLGDAIV